MPTLAGRVRVQSSAGLLVAAFLCWGCSGGPGSDGQPDAPRAATCPPGGFGNTTVIELAEAKGVCSAITTGADKIPTIWTSWGGFAFWEVCNRCTTAVDIKLRRWSSDPSEDFEFTIPMMNAGNEIELLRVGTYPTLGSSIRGLLKPGPRERASREYVASWRVSGELAYTDIDPRLEIERDHFALWEGLIKTFGPKPPR